MKVILVLFALVAVASTVRKFKNDQVLRISPTNEFQIDVLESIPKRWHEVDFWTETRGLRPVDLHVPAIYLPAIKMFLTRNKIDFTVFIADLQTAIDEQTSSRPEQMNLATFDYNVYHTLDEIVQWMKNIDETYENAHLFSVGQSFEGRETFGLNITSGVSDNPVFVLTCGIHSREWVSPATCLHSIKYLLEAKLLSPESNVLRNVDFYFIPVANPDGYEYTWSGDRLWRKTRSDYYPGEVNCIGVDPNRNWDIKWSEQPGASPDPCSDSYHGPHPFSEIEVENIKNLMSSAKNVQGFIDIHAYGQYWMFPYAYKFEQSPSQFRLFNMAMESTDAIFDAHWQLYDYGPISTIIYLATGSSVDYTYDIMRITCSFAVELRDEGRYGFTLPEAFIQDTAEEAWAGIMVIAEHIANGNCPNLP